LEAEFFEYLEERERIRLRKEAGFSILTDDPILKQYKFTNVFREHDRTSLELRDRFYTPNLLADRKSVLMNCALFRYFGTWEFAEAVGWQNYETFEFEQIKELARQRLAAKERVFTGAYVITNGGISAPKQEVVVDHYLKALHRAAQKIVWMASETNSWRVTANEMMRLPGFGGTGFMTKEILLDTTYTWFWSDRIIDTSFPVDWWSWTPIGPGARRGAHRVTYGELGSMSELGARGAIMILYKDQDLFLSWKRKLSPTDIQFGLCEFDKYQRVLRGEGRPRSKYRGR
ncbi:MAG: nucleotide kinase domain-containing protein, partial [Candidatus Thorarchaeota archaeon]